MPVGAPDRLVAALGGRYRIERELGAGGMATVYLAADLKHDRRVAIKVLKPELAAELGADRFLAEIRTTASLQHPHILPLFDSSAAAGFLYYVMPFVEGETLRDRLNRETQLPIDDALRITQDVADALDYAHRHHVIHRDIKPANILLHDGRPMVADFGIALAVSAAAGGRLTQTGLALGTPQYMSPEQATADKDITARADIYSLASVLYEMLAGDPPHVGSSAQQILMKIITEPVQPVTLVRKAVPEHVAQALAQALEKLPADRFTTAAEFSRALQGRVAPRVTSTATRNASSTPWRAVAIASAAIALGSAGLATWALQRGNREEANRPVEFSVRIGLGDADYPTVSISPDGRRILQSVRDSTGVRRIYVRDLHSMTVTPVAGTEGGIDPSVSYDGKWIAFTASERVWKVPSAGGTPTLIGGPGLRHPGWSIDGRYLLFAMPGRGLWRFPASGGGKGQRLTTLDSTVREWAHWNAQELPGGKAAIFNNFSTPLAASRIEAVEYATGKRTLLVQGAIAARYAPSGHLLYVRDAALFAAPFDAAQIRMLGPAVPVLEDVAWNSTNGSGGFGVSLDGTLTYVKNSVWSVPRRVVWVDRRGNERPAIPSPGLWAEPRVSPDGRWIAVSRLDPQWQIWLYDRTRDVMTQFTRSEGVSFGPLWAPDSRSLFHTVETPVYDLHRTWLDGSRAETLLVSTLDKVVTHISPDGRRLAYWERAVPTRVQFSGVDGGAPAPLESSGPGRLNAAFSPNGRWLAYEEVAPNQIPEVFIRARDNAGTRRQVSSGGGSQPRWTQGGRELVYRRGDEVYAVAFDAATGDAGTPVLLFRKPDAGRLFNQLTIGYDVTPDGSQFLMSVPVQRDDAQPVRVVLNWVEELKAKVPRP